MRSLAQWAYVVVAVFVAGLKPRPSTEQRGLERGQEIGQTDGRFVGTSGHRTPLQLKFLSFVGINVEWNSMCRVYETERPTETTCIRTLTRTEIAQRVAGPRVAGWQ